MNKVIAVDFDGTLCENEYPKIGKMKKWALIRLYIERLEGAKIILNTCRTGDLLDDAVAWCLDHGIIFDAINENLPERIEKFGGDCRKISADEYWDDKAVLLFVI